MLGANGLTRSHGNALRALVVSNDKELAERLARCAGEKVGIPVQYRLASQPDEAHNVVEQEAVDLVLIDAGETCADVAQLIDEILGERKDVICAVVTDVGDEELWVTALSAGAVDLIEKPFFEEAMQQLMGKAKLGAVA